MTQLQNSFPPHISSTDKVILFDGVCRLCNVWSRFIIKYDQKMIFKLAAVQSEKGQAILKHYDMPTKTFDTMLYLEGSRLFEKSDAFFRVIQQLNYPWKALSILRFFPLFIRNWLYDRIALNRYLLFGKYQQCLLPSREDNERFL
ncbi:thiol-disulfide oxidoreductase DCC family protein [Aliikangiella sp. IMCC44359]|uniref:thiol-disulfide oxidoreductase DCC family protein n=1 Tax=Aliikangiella sp. IMCC44359 TaxID=3459125 RepID=UPI00403A8237